MLCNLPGANGKQGTKGPDVNEADTPKIMDALKTHRHHFATDGFPIVCEFELNGSEANNMNIVDKRYFLL